MSYIFLICCDVASHGQTTPSLPPGVISYALVISVLPCNTHNRTFPFTGGDHVSREHQLQGGGGLLQQEVQAD